MANGQLLPSGYLSTSGNQIVDQNGNDVRIAAVGWNEVSADMNIQQGVDGIKADGFNAIRLDWQDATLAANMPLYQSIVQAASNDGIKVIFDHHANETPSASNNYLGQQPNGLPFDLGPGTDGTDGAGDAGTVTEQTFVNDTQTLAKAFAGNTTVIGFDLDNEPLENSATPATWGTGGPTDLQQIYQQAGDAVQAVDPGALIIAEGPIGDGQNGNPNGFDLTQAAAHPVVLNDANKLVYSVHAYPTSIGGEPIDTGSAFIQQMNQDWGYLETNNIAPVWIGEIGASLDGTADSSGGNLANEQAWAATMVAYLNGQDGSQGGPTFSGTQQGFSTDWWAYGYLPGQYPDGTQNADGSQNAGQEAIYSQFQYQPTSPPVTPTPSPTPTPTPTPPVVASTNDTVVMAGSTAAITDANGTTWTITAGGQVARNGTADTTTGSVIELAYVKGAVWQENASKLWWQWTGTGWSSGGGTATSPLPAPASANGSVVKSGSTAALIDASGNAWTITTGGQVALNGTADTTTASVIELAYVNGVLWQENASKLWWQWTGTGWSSGGGTATSPLPAPASANDTVLGAGSTAAITDASGNAWTITSGGQVAVNGTTDTTTASVIDIAYVNGVIWQLNAAGLWWSKTAPTDQWGPAAGTKQSPLPTSMINVNAAGLTQEITALSTSSTTVDGDVFSLTASGAIQATLGPMGTAVVFVGKHPVQLTGGSATGTVKATSGANSFTAGTGALIVAGGTGADAYFLNANSGLLTINDFSLTKGDTLTIAKSLQGALSQAADGKGGTMLSFGSGHAVDIRTMTSVPLADLKFV